MSTSPAQIFVIGDQEGTRRYLDELEEERSWAFHGLLDYPLSQDSSVPFGDKIARAVRQIEAAEVTPSAIVSYWDFPQMAMVSVLAEHYGLPAPSLESVIRCQHKYYGRVEHQRVVPEVTPRFAPVDPSKHRLEDIDLPLPFWVKPVRAHSSQLGFRIDDERDFEDAMTNIRAGISRFGPPTNEVLRLCQLPASVAHVDGNWCVAEAIISGGSARQCTAEGYARSGETPRVYGIIDSVTYADSSSFARYQYPSTLPDATRARIRETSVRLVEGLGLSDGAFNVEYFWDEETDRLSLLEVNARISQSHARLFRWADGVGNIERAVDVALGNEPDATTGRGKHAVVAKCFHRAFRDARVIRVPSREEISAIEREMKGVRVEIPPRGHEKLSDMIDQDSYSYELALIHLGAGSTSELDEKLEAVIDRLPIELESIEDGRRIDHRAEARERR